MRYLSTLLFFLILINFSGLPELCAGMLDNAQAIVAMEDESENKEKEDSNEKEEKCKEDIKESILAQDVFCAGHHSGPSIETMNGILRDSGYYPEDHSPPPELA